MIKKITRKVKAEAIKTLRLAFLKRQIFWGKYADNLLAAKKWYADRDVIIVYIQDDRLTTTVLSESKPGDPELAKVLAEAQLKEQRRSLRKQRKTVIWYVENHYFTRLLGWRPGKENIALQR